MLHLTIERVGPDGAAKKIGHAVIGRWSGSHIAAVADEDDGTCGWCRHDIRIHSWEHPRDEMLTDDGARVCRRCGHCYPDGAPPVDSRTLHRQSQAAFEQMGQTAPVHIAALHDDRMGYRVGKVHGHDPDDGPWALVADAIAACLADRDSNLTDQQRAVLEQAMGRA